MRYTNAKQLRSVTPSERLFLLAISPAFFFVAYDLVFYWPWIVLGDYSSEVWYLMSYFTTANFFFLAIFSLNLFGRKVYFLDSALPAKSHSTSLKLTALAVISIAVVLYQLGGTISLELAKVYDAHSEGGALFIFLHALIVYTILFGIYQGGAKKYAYYIAFFAILFSMLMGGRSAAIVWAIILVYLAIPRLNIKISHVLLAVSVLAVIFIAASIARGTVAINDNGVRLEALDYNQVFTLAETLNYTRSHGARFDLFLADVFNGFVPRSLNPEKETSTAFTREVFPWVWEMTSYTSGFYANLFFVFGYSAVLISPIIISLINFVYFKCIFSTSFTVSRFVVICLGICPVLIVRSGIFEQRIALLTVVILLGALLFKALHLRLVPRSAHQQR